MKIMAYSVFDKAVDSFLPPFFVPAKGAAIRSFTDALRDPQHPFAKHHEDYVLYEVGVFDDQSGLLVTQEPVRVIGGLEVERPG